MLKKLLVMTLLVTSGCQVVPASDEIDKELAAESELYEADVEDEETADAEPEEYEHEPADEQDEEFAEMIEADRDMANEPAVETQEVTPAGRFERLTMDCVVRDKPRGKRLHVLGKGRKLWVEVRDPGVEWFEVYTKKSLAYMHMSCFK